jgi:hypothetical protein
MSEQEARARQWWPADWADETMPPARAEPDEFLINANGHFWLGYAAAAADATDQEKRFFSVAVAVGDIVEFLCCDDLGAVAITINPDGSYQVHGVVPPECTHFWLGGDSDTLMHTLDDFVAAHVRSESDGGSFQKPAEETLRLARWSDPIPFKLSIHYDGNAPDGVVGRFVAVTAAEARQ